MTWDSATIIAKMREGWKLHGDARTDVPWTILSPNQGAGTAPSIPYEVCMDMLDQGLIVKVDDDPDHLGYRLP